MDRAPLIFSGAADPDRSLPLASPPSIRIARVSQTNRRAAEKAEGASRELRTCRETQGRSRSPGGQLEHDAMPQLSSAYSAFLASLRSF